MFLTQWQSELVWYKPKFDFCFIPKLLVNNETLSCIWTNSGDWFGRFCSILLFCIFLVWRQTAQIGLTETISNSQHLKTIYSVCSNRFHVHVKKSNHLKYWKSESESKNHFKSLLQKWSFLQSPKIFLQIHCLDGFRYKSIFEKLSYILTPSFTSDSTFLDVKNCVGNAMKANKTN